jgi:hypothetical protein
VVAWIEMNSHSEQISKASTQKRQIHNDKFVSEVIPLNFVSHNIFPFLASLASFFFSVHHQKIFKLFLAFHSAFVPVLALRKKKSEKIGSHPSHPLLSICSPISRSILALAFWSKRERERERKSNVFSFSSLQLLSFFFI